MDTIKRRTHFSIDIYSLLKKSAGMYKEYKNDVKNFGGMHRRRVVGLVSYKIPQKSPISPKHHVVNTHTLSHCHNNTIMSGRQNHYPRGGCIHIFICC